jgi:TPR repeat protein
LNYAEGYKWLTLAVKNGHIESAHALEALKQVMTKTQVRDGQAKLSDWVSHHPHLTLTATKADATKAEKREMNGFATAAHP